MKGWRLVLLLCMALLSEPVRPYEKWSRPETAAKRVDDWVPITASCPSCQKNLESSDEAGGVDEVGRLLNPPAVPSGRAFNFNSKQNNFNRAPTGEPYEITTPAATSAQFFGQQQAPKIPQPVHFPVPFFGQQNLFSGRFQGLPNFQPQFTFIPQPQIQPAPKENKVTFPESPFIHQQNKGSVQLVYVPIEALQRQKPRLQADRPIPQQSQIDTKTQSPFETGKLKFQRPPQPFEPQFPLPQQFEQESNRFAPPPPSPPSFEQNTGRFPPPSQLFEQGKPSFSNKLKEQRPEFSIQNEQPVSPQSFQFVEDARNPPSNFFQFHDNRFQKPSFEDKPKETKPQEQQNFTPNLEESRQESTQNFVSDFDGSRQRQGPQPQNFLSSFEETRPRQEPRPQISQPNFQETRPKQEQPPTKFVPKFEEPKLEPQQQFVPNFQETTRPRQESSLPPQFIPKFEEPKLEPQQQFAANFQETRPGQELPPPPQFVSKFEEPKLQSQPQFIPNFQETTRPRQEQPPQQFVPKFEEPKLEPQQQFVPNFQENRPRQELPPPAQQFVPKFEEPKLEPQQQFATNFQEIPQPVTAQQTFTPNFETLRPKPEIQPNAVPNFQDTRPKQEQQAPFVPNFEEVKQKSKPKVQSQSSTLTPQQSFNSPSLTEKVVQTPSTPYPPPHQPPLSVYMEKRLDNKINEVLTILKDAKTIPVLDTIGNRSPKVFVGPSDLDAPRGYVKFELPYLSSLDITKIDSMIDRLPFFVAPLNFKPPPGYAKIPFPPPHIGSVVVSSKSPVVSSTTEFNPFKLTSQLPTEVNSLQPSVSSTTQRGTERAQPSTDVTPSTPKRNRQRKPLHRGSLTSFSATTPLNDITERQKDQFTTPAELQKLPEISTLENEKPQFLESTPTSIRQKFTRKPVEQQQTVFETTPVPVFVSTQKQQFDNTQQQQFESTQPQKFNNIQQQQFDNTQQQQFESTQPQKFNNIQQQQFDNTQQQQFENTQQQQFDNTQQQQSDNTQSQQFFADQQVPHNQQNYLDTLSSWPQQEQQQQFFNNQQPSQQPLFENHQQLLENPSQTSQEQFSNNPQSQTDLNNSEINQQQFISSSTEKQIFKNFQQIQPLSQYQVGNNFLNQQQSSTEQVQSASNPPQTVSEEPLTVATLSPTDTPKLRQRLSYYDKLLLTSTQVPVEIPSTQNVIESSEKPKERSKLRPRQRLTTTKRPTTESSSISEEVSEQITETSTQRYNPLKRRRPVTTTTTETTEITRNPLRSRTTQASRSEFVRSRSNRRTTTTTTTTTSTTEAVPVQQQFQDETHLTIQQDEQKKIEEAASFWNEPVTVQQSHGYELDTRYTQAPVGPDSKFSSGEPPADEDFSKEKHYHGSGNDKKAHDPNVEKKTPGRRGHWVRVRVKKPQDNLDTAESQNSLGPLSANAIHDLVTKPTTEFEVSSSSAPEESSTTTTTTTIAPLTITASTTTDSNQKQLLVTTVSDNAEMIVTTTEEERPAETTQTPEVSPSMAKYPDDEQDEAFQRNLADMLAKFISGGNDEPRTESVTVSATAEESTADLVAETESTDSTIVTAAAVTELPLAPVTSTTTKVSMETEICYKGRCVKSKKNKQITDLVSEP